jgi:hypothetical protein
MGANLSSTVVVDTSKDIVSAEDALNNRNTLILWAGAIYAMGMIWASCALTDRWRGPRGEKGVSGAGVLMALFLSIMWPVVAVYLVVNS